MYDEQAEFIEALADYADHLLSSLHYDGEYSNDAIRIVDARNHLFRNITASCTDEEKDIYMLRDLVRINEQTFDYMVDQNRIVSIARNYFA
ncbi:MAG: hypothetical protein IJ553_04275 [Alloprevotella sp.]|nr:hypothetical protein [Alloprevotella sp.]